MERASFNLALTTHWRLGPPIAMTSPPAHAHVQAGASAGGQFVPTISVAAVNSASHQGGPRHRVALQFMRGRSRVRRGMYRPMLLARGQSRTDVSNLARWQHTTLGSRSSPHGVGGYTIKDGVECDVGRGSSSLTDAIPQMRGDLHHQHCRPPSGARLATATRRSHGNDDG